MRIKGKKTSAVILAVSLLLASLLFTMRLFRIAKNESVYDSGHSGAWTTPRGDMVHSGFTPIAMDMSSPPLLSVEHALNEGAMQQYHLHEQDGLDFLSGVAGNRVSVYRDDLTPLWSSGILNSPYILGNGRFGGAGESGLVVLDGVVLKIFEFYSGELLWSYQFPSVVNDEASGYSPRYDSYMKIVETENGSRIFAFANGAFYAFSFSGEASSGTVDWTYPKEALETPPLPEDGIQYKHYAYPPEVLAIDLFGDGGTQVCYATQGGIYMLDGNTGELFRSVEWISGDVDGRNYGELKAIDVNHDGILDFVLVMDSITQHVAVVVNEKDRSYLLWDLFFGHDFLEDSGTILVPSMDAIGDLTGRGDVEIAFSIFGEADNDPSGMERRWPRDGRWHTFIVKANLSHAPDLRAAGNGVYHIPDTYLHGAVYLNGSENQAKSLLLSIETGKNLAKKSRLAVYGFSGQGWGSISDVENAEYRKVSRLYENNQSSRARTGCLSVFTDNQGRIYMADGSVWQPLDGNTLTSGVAGLPLLNTKTGMISLKNGMLCAYTDGSAQPFAEAPVFSVESVKNIPVAADVDGDGINELLLASNGMVKAYRYTADGLDTLWEVPGHGARNAYGTNSVIAADMTGDGLHEILVRREDPDTGEARLSILDGSGSELWGFTFEGFCNSDQYSGLLMWTVGRFTGKATLDIMATLYQGGFNSEMSILIDGGSMTPIWEKNSANNRGFGPYSNFPTVADINENGLDDYIMIAKDWLYVYEYDGSGMAPLLEKLANQSNDFYYDTPVYIDVDGNGMGEYVMSGGFNGVSVVDYKGTTRWRHLFPGWDAAYRYFGIADSSGDGILDILVGRKSGMMESYDGKTGKLQWAFDLGANIISGSIATADLDGDRRAEAVFTASDGFLYAINGGSETQLRIRSENRLAWKIDSGGLAGAPVIADLDGDGYGEIIFLSGDSIHIYSGAKDTGNAALQ